MSKKNKEESEESEESEKTEKKKPEKNGVYSGFASFEELESSNRRWMKHKKGTNLVTVISEDTGEIIEKFYDNRVKLDDDVLKYFPTSKHVNEALRGLIQVFENAAFHELREEIKEKAFRKMTGEN